LPCNHLTVFIKFQKPLVCGCVEGSVPSLSSVM
jgi:hypothetical protein